MKNHPLYKRLKQAVLDGNYSIKQVENAGSVQVTKMLGTRSFSLAFLNNMKHLLIAEMQEKKDENDMQGLKQQAKTWLNVNFPGWQAERGRDGDKPFVKIWLKGKPEIE